MQIFSRVFVAGVMIAGILSAAARGQSVTQEFPTPISEAEINGTIVARDIGDSRLTTYFYELEGEQGDLFINILTRNLNADIDVFTKAGLKPVTKIVVYAGRTDTETGRAVYLRKPERLLLRVQGRTPNDDSGTFRIKFAGSFVAMAPGEDGPELPHVAGERRGNVRVNAIGTIIPEPPKPASEVTAQTPATDEAREPEAPKVEADAEKTRPRPIVVVSEPPAARAAAPARTSRRTGARTRPARGEAKPANEKEQAATVEPVTRERKASNTSNREARKRVEKVEKRDEPDPLASINLVVEMKDGSVLERRMNEVLKFSVDKGMLTIILKTGTIVRHPVTDVSKVTIQ